MEDKNARSFSGSGVVLFIEKDDCLNRFHDNTLIGILDFNECRPFITLASIVMNLQLTKSQNILAERREKPAIICIFSILFFCHIGFSLCIV
jgi:hypothetical protein